MAVANKVGNNIEIQIGRDIYIFRSLTWLEEIAIKEEKDLSRERQIMSKALISVASQNFSYEENLRIMKAVPLAIFKRVYTIYRALEAEGRNSFKTINLYIAPEVTKVLEKIKIEEEDIENTVDRILGNDDEEVKETEELIYKNSGLKGATKL